MHLMREAIIRADLDDLLDQIHKVEDRHPRLAQKLRRLAEHFEYQKLLDLFDRGEVAEGLLSPTGSVP